MLVLEQLVLQVCPSPSVSRYPSAHSVTHQSLLVTTTEIILQHFTNNGQPKKALLKLRYDCLITIFQKFPINRCCLVLQRKRLFCQASLHLHMHEDIAAPGYVDLCFTTIPTITLQLRRIKARFEKELF